MNKLVELNPGISQDAEKIIKKIYSGIKTRLFNKNASDYEKLKEMGISINESWLDANAFVNDVYPKYFDFVNEYPKSSFKFIRKEKDKDFILDNMEFITVASKVIKSPVIMTKQVQSEVDLKKNNGSIKTSNISYKSKGDNGLKKTIKVGIEKGEGYERYVMAPDEVMPVPLVTKKVRKTVSNCLKEDAENKQVKQTKEICANCGNIFFVSDIYDREGYFVSTYVLDALLKETKTAKELSDKIKGLDNSLL